MRQMGGVRITFQERDLCPPRQSSEVGVGWGALPSAVPERPSALKLLVLFFLRCLFLCWHERGGSSLGLAVLEMLGLEHRGHPARVCRPDRKEERRVSTEKPDSAKDHSNVLPVTKP